MKIFLATTLCDGKLYGDCSQSVLENVITLMMAENFVIHYPASELYIDHSRNFCVKLFMETDAEAMVFIDSDLKFEKDAILKLIKHDKDIVSGAYRYKKDFIEYPVILDFSRDNNCKEEETGLVYVESAPTGLMKISRKAFEKMRDHYDLKPDTNGIIHYFDTGMRFPGNEWWGEDSYFCKRWRDMGETMYVEPRINFTHIGTKEYTGNFHEYLMSRQVKNMDAASSGLPGWMTDNELSILKYIASKSDSVVEIGSWKGRSTKELLESCKGTVYAVDHWNGTETDASSLAVFGLNVYDEFMKNAGHYPNLEILRGNSLDMVHQFNGDKVDTVFIDAGHTYEECKADIETWLPKCKKIICGHDYTEGYPGVIKAVNEKFGKVNLIDSLWFVELEE